MNHKIREIIKEYEMMKNLGKHPNLINQLQLDVPEVVEGENVEIKLIMNQIKGVSLSNLLKKLGSISKTLALDKTIKITKSIL